MARTMTITSIYVKDLILSILNSIDIPKIYIAEYLTYKKPSSSLCVSYTIETVSAVVGIVSLIKINRPISLPILHTLLRIT